MSVVAGVYIGTVAYIVVRLIVGHGEYHDNYFPLLTLVLSGLALAIGAAT